MADVEFLGKREYRDISLSFARNPVTGDVVAVTGDEAVKRSLKTLLFTAAGEVPFFPEFGSRLRDLLFEPIDAVTTALLESEIRATIAAFEPRVRVRTLTVVPTDDENRYEVTLEFEIVNNTHPITLSLFLTRLR